MKGDEKSSLFFVIFSRTMEGVIYRVTYNAIKEVAEIHFSNGYSRSLPMKKEDWDVIIKGDVKENFNKWLSNYSGDFSEVKLKLDE